VAVKLNKVSVQWRTESTVSVLNAAKLKLLEERRISVSAAAHHQ
jgi:hypothetical protein